jgi:hypothetical protein
MTDTERTFTVTPPVPVVLEYLKDFSHTEQWDPGTEACRREDSGPIVVGSRWHNVSKVAGHRSELMFTLHTLEADHLVFVGENSSAVSTDDIRLTAVPGGGTQLRYHSHVEFHGMARAVGTLLGPTFEHLGDQVRERLTDILNRLPVS